LGFDVNDIEPAGVAHKTE